MDNGCNRAVKVWHRRAGKDKTDLNFQIKRAFERKGYYPYFFPTSTMGRRIIWDGMDRNGHKFLDHFPKELIAKEPNQTEMKITLKNGSIWQIIGTDKVENVGINPIGCVFSEYSLQNPKSWNLVRPILAENGGWAVFNYTPRGKNHGYDLYKMAKANPKWFCELLNVTHTNAITQAAIQEERDSGMSEEMIMQEFYCSFDLGQEGSYYGKQMSEALVEGRIRNVLHDPGVPVYTAWDLGVGDSMPIWFFQLVGNEVHWIDYYESSGEGLPHYIGILDEKRREKGYLYAQHFAPHDIEARELSTGLSRKMTAAELGIDFTTVELAPIADGIEASRSIIKRSYFDEQNCAYGIKCIENYQKKFDEKNNVYSKTPLHNWASHGADAFRYGSMGKTEISDSVDPEDDDNNYSAMGA